MEVPTKTQLKVSCPSSPLRQEVKSLIRRENLVNVYLGSHENDIFNLPHKVNCRKHHNADIANERPYAFSVLSLPHMSTRTLLPSFDLDGCTV